MHPLKILSARPFLFDHIKRWSRRLGRVNALYLRLASDPQLHRSITFLQIGANDGIARDPIREFIVRYGWNGIAVEPLPSMYSLLKRDYARYPAVTPVNCAISYGGGSKLTLFCVSDSALNRYPSYASMIASANPLHLK